MKPILTSAQALVTRECQQQAFDTPHRPDTTSTRYTLWTEHHDLETADLNPCAVKLYRWLLERAAGGIEQEVDLEQFQQSTISQKREKGYHIKHILRSFSSLLTAGFVVVTRPYTLASYAVGSSSRWLTQASSVRTKKFPTEPTSDSKNRLVPI